MIQVPETPSPLHGAAWLVLFEQLVPHTVTTQEKLEDLRVRVHEKVEWAGTQTVTLYIAYAWAASKIVEAAENVVRTNELQLGVMAATKTIPRPPE